MNIICYLYYRLVHSWGPWQACDARCESDGFRVRNRIVIQEADCGGNRCEYESETTTCKGPCCPQDCVIGQWSDWSVCDAVCGVGNMTRTRFIKYPVCGGANCTETEDRQSVLCERFSNIDCVMAPWSEWTECKLNNSFCGEGTKKRQRSIVINSQCNGQPCPPAEETALCYGNCCVTDCQVGSWTQFGFCSTQCGEGKKNRTRPILVAQSCGGAPCPDVIEFTSCTAEDTTNCSFTEWSKWSECSTDCGKGKSIRTRTLLTPAYCGGQCQDILTENQIDCESYTARRDCQVSAWGEWGPCIRNCERGMQRSSRNVTVVEACGGIPCSGQYNLTQTRTCHEKCEQLCNQGRCSCNLGYVLNGNGYSCSKQQCLSSPKIVYCGPGTVAIESCLSVLISCNPSGSYFGDRCISSCSKTGWIVKGSPNVIECQADGTWTSPKIFCGPPNKAPLSINVNATNVSELLKVGQCFAKLTTVTDNEAWDKHSYSVIVDPSGALKATNDSLCLKQLVDYETSAYRIWNATIRSTDLDGLYVDAPFTFKLIDENDPPRSAKLVPSNFPENSPKGTEIGCFELMDDEAGQTLTVSMLTSANLFELFKKSSQTCLRVLMESNVNCSTLGGKLCAFNYEVKSQYFVAISVKDDGSPPAVAYFSIEINVTDINEPITDVTFTPDAVAENIVPGKPLLQLTAVDEDRNKQSKFELLSDPYGVFRINNNTLTATVSLDYEINPTIKYNLRVRGTDLISPVSSVDVNIIFGVKDVNEPPYMLQLTSANALTNYQTNKPLAKENVPAIVVGTVSVLDPDKGDNITLSVNSDKFRIIGAKCSVLAGNSSTYCTGKLVCLAGFNYEEAQMVSVKIKAQDSLLLDVQLDVNITVINMDDPPKDILINDSVSDSIIVSENSKNSTVAVLKTNDEDVDDTYNYFLSGPMANQFRIDGNILYTTPSSNLDYETYLVSQLIITTVSTNRAGLSMVKTFQIIVSDVNEAPTKVVFSKTTVPENSPEGTLVSELSVLDPDNTGANTTAVQSFTFELLADAQGRFYLKNGLLFVKTSTQFCGQSTCSLDFESQSSLSVTIRVTDSGTPSLSLISSQTIAVTDVNDPPSNIQISTSQIKENKPSGAIIGTLSAFDQDKNSLTYLILNNTEVFSIDERNNLIQLKSLDYEAQSVYFVNVQVTDNGAPSMSSVSSIKIDVMNVNEAPLFLGTNFLTAKENSNMGTEVGALLVTDPDNGDSVELTLKTFKDIFIVGNKNIIIKDTPGTNYTASLTTGVILDYETQSEYSVSLSLIDKQGLETVVTLTISVLDENDFPQDILLNNITTSTLSVKENTLSTLAVLTAIDQDKSQTFSFSIISQPGDNFVVIGNELKVSVALDYETSNVINITLEVTDNGSPPYKKQKMMTINVMDMNEPPSDLKLTNNKVEENSIDGTVVGAFQVSDPDNKIGFTFSLLDSANGKFRINGDKLVVVSPEQCTVNQQRLCSLNYEKTSSHTVKVIVTDSGSPQESAIFSLTIDVTDANDAPTDIVLSDNKVDFSAKAGTVIGQFNVIDEDSQQTKTFILKDDAGGTFKIMNGTSTLIKADVPLTTSRMYSVLVAVQDNGIPSKSAEQTFYINIVGVNEAPQNLTVTANNKSKQVDTETIAFNESLAINDDVAIIRAEDINLDQKISFSLLNNENNQFQLDKNVSCNVGAVVVCSSNIILAKGVNFEKQDKYNIILVATDSNNQQTSKAISVQILDLGEAPTDIVFSALSITVAENSVSVVLGSFTAVDEDKSDSHSFTLENNPENIFSISASGELSVTSGAKLDFETKSLYNITVVVTDSTRNLFKKIFNVNVQNVNEPPSSVKLINNTIPEGSEAYTVIGDLFTDDPDNNNLVVNSTLKQTFEYLLLDDAGGRFQLTQSTLKLTPRGAQCTASWCGLDFETQRIHQLQVQVTDSGSPKLTANLAFTVQVQDANDAPVFIGANLQLKENMKVGENVTRLSASDADLGQNLTYKNESDINPFTIVGNQLLLANPLDFESNPTIVVQITVMDSGIPALSAKASFNFEILNVGEAPSSLTLVNLNSAQSAVFTVDQPVIGENTKLGTTIGQLTILDPDFDEDITATVSKDVLKAEKPSCLTVTKQGSRCVSSIILNKALDFETQSTYSIGLSVIDKYGLRLDKNFTLQVKDENDPPINILINNEVTSTIKVKENSQGMIVANLSAIDPDKGQTFVFTVSSSTQFYITDNTLKVSVAAIIDYERIKTLALTLRVTDSGQPPLSLDKNITVEVLDVNEAPTTVVLTRNKVSEDASIGNEIGSFVTTDPDNKEVIRQSFVYELLVNPNNIFGIRNGSLVLASAQLDYEMRSSYVITVKVTDNGSPPLSAQFDFSIEVINVNEAPTNLQLSATTVSESAFIDSTVGVLSAQDSDVGQTITFTVANSDCFSVNGNLLIVSGMLDFETAPRLLVEVTATDSGTPPKSVAKNFTITVTDANDSPLLMNYTSVSANQTIDEKTLVNAVVGSIETYDPDNLDRISIELTDASAKNFKLDTAEAICKLIFVESLRSTCTVCSQKVLLAQTVRYIIDSPPLVLEAFAKDKGQLSITNSWKITVLDSNDPPFNISIDATKLEIPENQRIYKLGLLTCDDPDIGQTHLFQVITNYDVFAVDASSVLVILKALDYEQQPSYQLTLRCVDSGVPSANYSKTFLIAVLDVNEQPSDIKLSNSDISAAAKDGETVAFILVTDPDNAGANTKKQNHTCVLIKDESGSFKVGKDGLSLQILVKPPVNRTSVKIQLNCSDNGVPSMYFVKDFDIFISNTAQVPKAIQLTGNRSVSENSINVEVGQLSIINTLTETEIPGTYNFIVDSGNFTVERISLRLTTSLDYETSPVLTIIVTALGSDSNNNKVKLSETFKIQVLDVNEPPKQINIYGGGQVLENSAPGTVVGDLNTVDPELYQTFTYTLISVAVGFDVTQSLPELLNTFQISGRTLKIGINNSILDYETTPVFSLVIQTMDSGDPPLALNDTLRIILLNVNDAPTDVKLNNSLIPENTPAGTLVGVFSVVDQDVNQTYSCVVNNLDSVPFTVESSLNLKVSKAELDYETQKYYILQVTCQDTGSDGSHLKVTKSLMINVTNVNEPPYDLRLSTYSINENNIVDQLVAEIAATDPDSQQTFFTLTDDSSSFDIHGTGSLVAKKVIDYETKSKYTISVKAADENGLTSNSSFVIQVIDVNEKPTDVQLTQKVVSESAPRGTVIGSIVTQDPDRRQTFQYNLTEPPPSTDHFYIVGDQLLVGQTSLDFEFSSVYRISITSTDSGSPAQSLTVDFDIQVTDANEPPSGINVLSSPISVFETASINTVLSDILVIDVDKNQTHSCQTVDSKLPFVFITSLKGTIQLIVGNVLNFEAQSIYHVNVSCSDGEFSIYQVITITVKDVNEPPTAITLKGPHFLPATAIAPYPIDRLLAEDDDIGQMFTFSTSGTNSDLLQ
ncbi:protocadherin Fat 4, partial [Biomphalaria glabrata]